MKKGIQDKRNVPLVWRVDSRAQIEIRGRGQSLAHGVRRRHALNHELKAESKSIYTMCWPHPIPTVFSQKPPWAWVDSERLMEPIPRQRSAEPPR